MVKDLVPDHLQRSILKDVPNEITIQDCHFRPLRGVAEASRLVLEPSLGVFGSTLESS